MTVNGSTPQALDAQWPRDFISARVRPQQVVLESYRRSGVTPEQYAESVVAYAESSAEVARRANVRKRVDMLRDAWGPLLKSRLENWLVPAVQDAVMGRAKDHLDLSRNPAKNIWSELAITYHAPPQRRTPKQEDDVEKYNLLLEGTGFELFWQTVELYLVACNEVLIWPDVIERNGKKTIKHRLSAGDQAVIVTLEEDPTEIEAVMLIDDYADLSGTQHRKYRLWTPHWHAEFERNKEGKIERTGQVPERADEDDDPERDTSYNNPYGRLHMTLVRLWPWGDTVWDATGGEDLVDLTLSGGEERMLYRYQQKMSGFKQLAVTGSAIDKPPQQLCDPGQVVTIDGSNLNLTVIDWQVDMKSRLECMMIDELAAAASRGINPERYKKTASYQTGTGAKLAERGLAKHHARLAMICGAAERSYKENLCIVARAHGLEDPPDPDIPLEVQFAPLAYPEDPKTQLETEGMEVAMGQESHVTLMMRRHPEWTEKQAEEAIKARLDQIAMVNDMKAAHNVPDNTMTESRSAEANGRMGPATRDSGTPPGSPPGQGPPRR